MDLVTCPECGQPADVEWRDSIPSTDGPIEIAKTRCTLWHHFLMPTEGLVPLGTVPAPAVERHASIAAR